MRRIEVVNYSDNWPSLFEAEKKLIADAIPIADMQIYHIGSTSVKGLAAKPIIDILIATETTNELDQFEAEFEQIGYKSKGEFGISGRRYYQKGGASRTHQIHAFDRHSEHITRYLAFREYLTCHPSTAKEYEILKIEAALNCAHDIEKYGKLKHEFIEKQEQVAFNWYNTQPALLGKSLDQHK